MSQTLLGRRYYDWFYGRFTLIAVPPLILYWVGLIHRICQNTLRKIREEGYCLISFSICSAWILVLISFGWKMRCIIPFSSTR